MKMYVLVRDDLTKSQQAVQGGHALAQFMIEHPFNGWKNGTLIYLRLSKEDLAAYYEEWRKSLKYISKFNEPDLNDEMTAFAFVEPTPEVVNMKLL